MVKIWVKLLGGNVWTYFLSIFYMTWWNCLRLETISKSINTPNFQVWPSLTLTSHSFQNYVYSGFNRHSTCLQTGCGNCLRLETISNFINTPYLQSWLTQFYRHIPLTLYKTYAHSGIELILFLSSAWCGYCLWLDTTSNFTNTPYIQSYLT